MHSTCLQRHLHGTVGTLVTTVATSPAHRCVNSDEIDLNKTRFRKLGMLLVFILEKSNCTFIMLKLAECPTVRCQEEVQN